MLGGLNTAEITHQLRRSLGDKGPFLSEFFGVGNTVIALIRRAQARKFVGMGHPVKAAADVYKRQVRILVRIAAVPDSKEA